MAKKIPYNKKKEKEEIEKYIKENPDMSFTGVRNITEIIEGKEVKIDELIFKDKIELENLKSDKEKIKDLTTRIDKLEARLKTLEGT